MSLVVVLESPTRKVQYHTPTDSGSVCAGMENNQSAGEPSMTTVPSPVVGAVASVCCGQLPSDDRENSILADTAGHSIGSPFSVIGPMAVIPTHEVSVALCGASFVMVDSPALTGDCKSIRPGIENCELCIWSDDDFFRNGK